MELTMLFLARGKNLKLSLVLEIKVSNFVNFQVKYNPKSKLLAMLVFEWSD